MIKVFLEFSRYKVIETPLTNKEGKKIFWVLKKKDGKDDGYVYKPSNPSSPFEFTYSVFTEDFIAVKSGFMVNERNEILKNIFLILSTKDWKPVILAKVGSNTVLKCTDPVLSAGKIKVSLILPKEVILNI